jgi:hypothetical protein
MKLKNLTELAEFLKQLDNDSPRRKLGFDMTRSYNDRHDTPHPCGSACCIGGWVQYHNKGTRNMDVDYAVMTITPEGISEVEVYRLCFPIGNQWYATPQQAARAVEILRDTGKCDWERAFEEVPA